jgi:L-fuconate dehydratase
MSRRARPNGPSAREPDGGEGQPSVTRILGFETHDLRFPTSRNLDGSDAMNSAPDYSAAYLTVQTDSPDGLAGHAHVFTIGRETTSSSAPWWTLRRACRGR